MSFIILYYGLPKYMFKKIKHDKKTILESGERKHE